MTKIIAVLCLISSIYSHAPHLSEKEYINHATTAILSGNFEYSTSTDIDSTLLNIYTYALKTAGYLDTDNISTDSIRNAIMHFQADQNIIVDGTIGPNTIEKLKYKLSGNCINDHDKLETETPDGNWIVINLTKRILTLYHNETVVSKYPIAVGNPPSLSPSGKFSVANKVVNPTWGGGGYTSPIPGGSEKNPLGYRWIGLSHLGGNVYGIHGNNNPFSIGTNASKGCIRMLNQDVEELFASINIANEIWMGSDQFLKECGVFQNECEYEK